MLRSFWRIGRRDARRWALAAVSVALVTAFFQNCTQATSVTQSSLSQQATALNFAYVARFDQVAYMSCEGLGSTPFDTHLYWTFKAGAYRTGGLGLSANFLNVTRGQSPATQATKLSLSPVNSDTGLQLALRSANNLQTVFAADATVLRANSDYADFFPSIGYPVVSSALLSQAPNLVRVNPSSSFRANFFEANLSFNRDPAMAQNVRSYAMGSSGSTGAYLLALTYNGDAASGSGNDAVAAKSPGDGDSINRVPPNPALISRSVYGRGLRLNFAQPSTAGLPPGFPNSVLANVSERDLGTGGVPTDSPNASWSCPASFQLAIVRPEDSGFGGASGCVPAADPMFPSTDLQAIRYSLRSEDWYVDMAHHCVIPKPKSTGGSTCYASNLMPQYSLSGVCGGTSPSPCMAFVSICYRQY